MTRRRGVTVELLDYTRLVEACREHHLAQPSFGGNALLRNDNGQAIVLSYEGVGSTNMRDGMVGIDTQSYDWEYLPLEAAEACRTGETKDLADHIRTFGSRLDVNHLVWFEWAQEGQQ